jgi:hypothetical protein
MSGMNYIERAELVEWMVKEFEMLADGRTENSPPLKSNNPFDYKNFKQPFEAKNRQHLYVEGRKPMESIRVVTKVESVSTKQCLTYSKASPYR